MQLIANNSDLQLIAQNQLQSALLDDVRRYAALSMSPNTRRAYSADLRRFTRWGGGIPALPETVAAYLAAHASTHKSATLQRWIASISRAHLAAGHLDPTKAEPTISTLRGIRRSKYAAPKEARPLLRDDLFAILDAMKGSVRDVRDRALLLIGFAGGFRRSELVALDIVDIQIVKHGLLIAIHKSKTDQMGLGRQIAVPFGRSRHCPVDAFEKWVNVMDSDPGPLFRPINRYGLIGKSRLSGGAVSEIVKERVAAIGMDPIGFSGHSLRSGFVTSAAEAGVSSWKIRQQTGHASDTMLARYIRSAKLFEGNASSAII
ncbi:tyrosine-type recombinase/integrase [Agrobacterium sp. rho-13.3]|uniref:tyrosine-type recombinase/integrase n=1 Tax=Agrobacterium sp. rho-13.3 TaxID=3072980 RepID=UPI002A0CC428|nr:tyrosine-type recombinase/integrase [Agrobacterium sp. rho-13.3]MDX8307807.1 tyrosine-type recombinase/integrase [Agrobacterium sp. rho-13.3]